MLFSIHYLYLNLIWLCSSCRMRSSLPRLEFLPSHWGNSILWPIPPLIRSDGITLDIMAWKFNIESILDKPWNDIVATLDQYLHFTYHTCIGNMDQWPPCLISFSTRSPSQMESAVLLTRARAFFTSPLNKRNKQTKCKLGDSKDTAECYWTEIWSFNDYLVHLLSGKIF